MANNNSKIIFKKKNMKMILIIFIFFITLLINSILLKVNIQNYEYNARDSQYIDFDNQNLKNSEGESTIFEGNEESLNITDNGNLYKNDQHVSLKNQEKLNLTYYLDDMHDWEASKIENSIKNIQDKRNWINNSGFLSPTIYRVYENHSTYPHYDPNQNINWNNPVSDTEITVPGAQFIRVHFLKVEFELDYDFLFICNGSNEIYYVNSSGDTDFYSPWIHGETIKLLYESDGSIEYFGYEINFYEYVNSTSNININLNEWGFNYQEVTNGFNYHGTADVDNSTGHYIALYGEYIAVDQFSYDTGAFSEIQQNFTIPSGPVVEAYLSFDYYCQYALPTNDHYIYIKLNDQKIFSKGMLDITELGKRKWLTSGRLFTDAWDNLTEIFTKNVYQQQFNISLGFMIGEGYTYTGLSHEGLMNIIYFDNISLVVTTRVNSTQNGIDLRINGKKLDDRDVWGHSNKTITDIWDSNPIILTLNSTSPHLTFDMNTTIYGYRKGTSMINQQGKKGISYQILSNGTIYWEFYHNLYVPSEYSDMEFSIEKPEEWDFIFVKDSTLQNIPFELGKSGDSILKVNKSYAIFPGWWSFKAKSPNYFNKSNTKILKDGQWESTASFNTGESTEIKTQLNYTNKIPNDVGDLNLTIYYPNCSIFYEESKEPVGGNVVFSQITFGSSNTSGGVYKYTLFWSNGTALGGLNSSFIVIHDTLLTLLKPDDAKIDFRTEGFVGDIIPIRVLLKDSENNFTISNAVLLYNWTDGTRYFTESALGIYETIIDTADLLTRGLHEILIKSLKTGFFDSNITLEINLGEETNLQVLDSDYNIELHANGSIRFKFSDFDGDGIDGAIVNISISNKSLYSINNPGNGTYFVEFSTLYIESIGIYQLSINFSAVNYEPQYYIYQFQIIKQSVNITLYLNSQNINENSLSSKKFNERINISSRALSNIDKEFLSGGNMTLICGDYQQNLTEYGIWYNGSILCTPEIFSFGINYVYLEFQHSNYRTATFGFQLLMQQLEIKVVPIGFNNSIQAGVGETLNIQITLMDPETNDYFTDATVRLSWEYGVGRFNEITPGTYQTTLTLPKDLRGNHQFNLIITSNNTVYKTTQYSFWVSIETIVKEDEFPVLLVLIIIGILTIIISALGVLSMRSYVILPRRRKKESELLAKTQRFKDLRNIQAIVIIHSLSGIPLYSKSYSILEKHKKELFSGFIQAITTIGEEFSEEQLRAPETEGLTRGYGIERIIELDFKYFYCLIADKEDIRVVFILKEKSSERLKSQISHLLLALNLKLSKELENWDGSLDVFEDLIPIILNDYFELFYKEQFKLSSALNLLEMKKEKKLSKMEVRVINVIQSMSKRNNNITNLYNIVELVSEENKDLIIEAIESLIKRQIVIPFNQ